MLSVNYSRTSNLCAVFKLSLTSVEHLVYGQFNCSKTSYLCSDFATVEPLVYVQF